MHGCLRWWQVGLHNDDATAISYASGIVSNSQCSLDTSNARAQVSGNTVRFSVPLSFKTSFWGLKTVYVLALDSGNLSSGWNTATTWTIPNSNVPPQPTSASPSSGLGATQTFTFGFNNPSGGLSISTASVLFNTGVSANNACYITYATGQIGLLNDAANATTYGLPGTAQTLSNSQCSIDLSTAGVSTSSYSYSTSLTMTVPITFSASFAVTKSIYGYGAMGSLSSGWITLGSWSVPSANTPPIAYPATSAYYGTYSFYDAAGAKTIGTALILINTGINSSGACYLQYSTGRLGLLNDNATAILYGTSSNSSLSNSQCTLSS